MKECSLILEYRKIPQKAGMLGQRSIKTEYYGLLQAPKQITEESEMLYNLTLEPF